MHTSTAAHAMSTRPRSFIQDDILNTPDSQIDLIQEGPFATVSRTWKSLKKGSPPQWVVIKSASTLRKFAREPHDIVKELRLLSSMVHLNIVYVLGSFHDSEQKLLSIYMPYFPLSLSEILVSPYFSPYPLTQLLLRNPSSDSTQDDTSTQSSRNADLFIILTKSIMIQALSALAFLHDEQKRIAHRDIKPQNILLTEDGCVKLIDFGVAYKECERDVEKSKDLWPEYKGKLYFEVSTGPYRAPELLFGSRNYDPCAIDLWSLGVSFAEFFTPLRLTSNDEDDGDDDDDTELEDGDTDTNSKLLPYIVPKYLRVGYPGAEWKRDSLFNGERGEIGLAWSIFKIFGTPSEENWPKFKELPGANSVVFNIVPQVPLEPLLPNIPPLFAPPPPSTSTPASSEETTTAQGLSAAPSSGPISSSESQANDLTSKSPPTNLIIDFLSSFLKYPSASRIRAEDAMRHPLFTTRGVNRNHPLLLPKGYALQRNQGWLRDVVVHEWKGKSVGDLIGEVLVGNARDD